MLPERDIYIPIYTLKIAFTGTNQLTVITIVLRNHTREHAQNWKEELRLWIDQIRFSEEMSSGASTGGGGSSSGSSSGASVDKKREKTKVSRTSMILWHSHQNDAAAVRKLLEDDPSLVMARDYDNRTPLHVASLHGWIDVAKYLIEFGADVNAQDRWRNTVLFSFSPNF